MAQSELEPSKPQEILSQEYTIELQLILHAELTITMVSFRKRNVLVVVASILAIFLLFLNTQETRSIPTQVCEAP